MTNTQIIKSAVQAAFSADQISALFTAYFPKEQGGDPEVEALFVADLFHTFAEWKARGLSVKKGEKAALRDVYLWKWTDKPNAAARKAAEEKGEELNPDPHYYKTPSCLFSIAQVEKQTTKPAPKKANVAGYNRYLMQCRKAGQTPVSMAQWTEQTTKPAETKPTQPINPAAVVAVVEHHEVAHPVELDTKPTKKAATKKATTKAAPKKGGPRSFYLAPYTSQPIPLKLDTSHHLSSTLHSSFHIHSHYLSLPRKNIVDCISCAAFKGAFRDPIRVGVETL